METLGYPLMTVRWGCCGAVPGATFQITAARPFATGSRASTGSTVSVFELYATPRGLCSPLLFCTLALYSEEIKIFFASSRAWRDRFIFKNRPFKI